MAKEPKMEESLEEPGPAPPVDDMPEPLDEAAPQGDMICVKRMPGRFVVCRKPLEAETVPAEGEAPREQYEEIEVDTIEQALKAVFKMHKDQPMDDSEDAHMSAAFDSGQPGRPESMTSGY